MNLITPSLLNSFAYYLTYETELTIADGENNVTIEQKEAAVREEFLNTLRRVRTAPTESMQKGIDLEDRIRAYCDGAQEDDRVIIEIGNTVKGGGWQQVVKRELDGFLLYGKVDVMKTDTLHDIKFTGSYDLGKFQKSAQHRIYFYCSGLPKFSYHVTDGRYVWREDYANHAGIEHEIRTLIREFTGYLENDSYAKELYYANWKSFDRAAA